LGLIIEARFLVLGKLIVFEGIDGSGKSTQTDLICKSLAAQGCDFRRLSFPRYDEPSSMLIRMYLGGDFGENPDDINAYAASSFFAADRYASFVQDWGEYYTGGGLVITDRYTTSNALHQGAKMGDVQRRMFFKWLYEYEFELIGLPKPDLVFYFDIDVALAEERMSARRERTGTSADIHEQDLAYLTNCAQSGLQAAAQFHWYVVDSMRAEDQDQQSQYAHLGAHTFQDKYVRSPEDIHDQVLKRLLCLID